MQLISSTLLGYQPDGSCAQSPRSHRAALGGRSTILAYININIIIIITITIIIYTIIIIIIIIIIINIMGFRV